MRRISAALSCRLLPSSWPAGRSRVARVRRCRRLRPTTRWLRSKSRNWSSARAPWRHRVRRLPCITRAGCTTRHAPGQEGRRVRQLAQERAAVQFRARPEAGHCRLGPGRDRHAGRWSAAARDPVGAGLRRPRRRWRDSAGRNAGVRRRTAWSAAAALTPRPRHFTAGFSEYVPVSVASASTCRAMASLTC